MGILRVVERKVNKYSPSGNKPDVALRDLTMFVSFDPLISHLGINPKEIIRDETSARLLTAVFIKKKKKTPGKNPKI